MYRFLILPIQFFCALLFCSHTTLGQDNSLQGSLPEEAEHEEYHSVYREPIPFTDLSSQPMSRQYREVKKEEWEKLSSDPVFRYKYKEIKEELPNQQMDWWLNMLTKLFQFFASGFGKMLIWILVALMVLGILFNVLQARGNIFFSKKDKKMPTQHAENADSFLPDNWESAIEEAKQDGNYRLAVRYAYRHLLVLLQEKEMIQYQAAKTNYHYGLELAGTSFHKDFLQITLQYEYIWYGEFEIGQSQFNHYYQVVKQIKSKLG